MKIAKLLVLIYLAIGVSSCQKEDLTLDQPQKSEINVNTASTRLVSNDFLSITEHPLLDNSRFRFYKHDTGIFKGAIWKVSSYETIEGGVYVSKSVDGINWTQIHFLPDDYIGSQAQLIVFNDELWLLGNRGPEDRFYTPLYKSKNGIDWNKILGPFENHQPHNLFVLKNRLYVHTFWGNIFYTENGIKWVGVTNFLPSAMGRPHKMVVFKNEIYAFTGGDYDRTSDTHRPIEVWKSRTGNDWSRLLTSYPFISPRFGYSVTAYKGLLWVIGGQHRPSYSSWTMFNDIWYTKDMVNWKKYSAKNPIKPMWLHSATVFNDKLWLFDGTPDDLTKSSTYSIGKK